MIEFKFTYNFKSPTFIDVTKLQPGVVKIPGDWGIMTYNEVIYQTFAVYVIAPSWHALMNQRYAMEVQVKGREYYGKSLTMSFFFETDANSNGLNGFLYAFGLGTGDIAKLGSGETKSMGSEYQADIVALVGEQKEFMAYHGHSLVDDCEETTYIFTLSSVYVSYQQATELQGDIRMNPLVPVKFENEVFQNFDPTAPPKQNKPPPPPPPPPPKPPKRDQPYKPQAP